MEVTIGIITTTATITTTRKDMSSLEISEVPRLSPGIIQGKWGDKMEIITRTLNLIQISMTLPTGAEEVGHEAVPIGKTPIEGHQAMMPMRWSTMSQCINKIAINHRLTGVSPKGKRLITIQEIQMTTMLTTQEAAVEGEVEDNLATNSLWMKNMEIGAVGAEIEVGDNRATNSLWMNSIITGGVEAGVEGEEEEECNNPTKIIIWKTKM